MGNMEDLLRVSKRDENGVYHFKPILLDDKKYTRYKQNEGVVFTEEDIDILKKISKKVGDILGF